MSCSHASPSVFARMRGRSHLPLAEKDDNKAAIAATSLSYAQMV